MATYPASNYQSEAQSNDNDQSPANDYDKDETAVDKWGMPIPKGVEPRLPFKCPVCWQEFANPAQLNVHQSCTGHYSIYSGQKPRAYSQANLGDIPSTHSGPGPATVNFTMAAPENPAPASSASAQESPSIINTDISVGTVDKVIPGNIGAYSPLNAPTGIATLTPAEGFFLGLTAAGIVRVVVFSAILITVLMVVNGKKK